MPFSLPGNLTYFYVMVLLSIEVKNEQALKKLQLLEQKHLIKINDDAEIHSPALPGKPLSLKAFKNWIKDAETTPVVSLKEVKQRWAAKRKQLQQLTK